MEKILIAIIGTSLAVGLLFIAVVMATIVGGISAWIVGGIFPYVTDTIREVLGLTLTNFEIGAALGFVSGFFRSSTFKTT